MKMANLKQARDMKKLSQMSGSSQKSSNAFSYYEKVTPDVEAMILRQRHESREMHSRGESSSITSVKNVSVLDQST